MAKMTADQVLESLGASPAEIAGELSAFSGAAQVLSSDHPRMIDQHPLQWVGVYQGRVAATGATMKSVMQQLENEGISPAKTIIRYIDTQERTLIL